MNDGSVVLEAVGDDESLHTLRFWCKSGPPLAKVELIEDEIPQEDGSFPDFVIKRNQ